MSTQPAPRKEEPSLRSDSDQSSSSSRTPVSVPRRKHESRKQSVKRHEQHRDAKQRADDLPTCPSSEDLMNEIRMAGALDSDSRSDKQIDPYADLPTHLLESEPRRAPGRIVSRQFQAPSMSPNISQLRQEVHETLVAPNRRTEGFELHGTLSRSESYLSTGRMPSAPVSLQLSGTFTINDRDGGGDGEYFLNLLKGTFSICGFLTQELYKLLQYKYAPYLVAALVLYLSTGLLEKWAASLFAALVGWVWPPVHFAFSTTAGLLWRMADWLLWMDDFWRSVICDMAACYCRRYHILCDRQCSFVDRVVERSAMGAYNRLQ